MNTMTRTGLLINDLTPETLIATVRDWGREKGINDALMQYAKFNEEAGEIAHELTRNRWNSDEMKDALGDTLVTLIILADILGYDIIDCLLCAYEEIKDRKGKNINGSFVKEEQ